MPEQKSSMHAYLNWSKQRIDEMDATLASLQTKASRMSAESKANSDQLIADLKKRRDEFQAKAKVSAQAGETELKNAKARLKSHWAEFETQVKAYFKIAGKQVKQQQATFRGVAAAQAKAWREAAAKLRAEAAKAAAVRRVEIDGAIKQMKGDAAEAQARLKKLKRAGTETWSALSGALAESRRAFDRANHAAWNALKRSTPSKS